MTKNLVLCGVLFAAAPARAETVDQLKSELSGLAAELQSLESFAGYVPHDSAKHCHALVAQLRAAGIAQTDELCDEYARWSIIAMQDGPISDGLAQLEDRGPNPDAARDCKAAIAAIRATGLREDVVIDYGKAKGTVRELDKKICDALGPPAPAVAMKPEVKAPAPEKCGEVSAAVRAASDKFAKLARNLADARNDIQSFNDRANVADCADAVAGARKAGATALVSTWLDTVGTKVTGSNDYEVAIDQASSMCTEYAQLAVVAARRKIFLHALKTIPMLTPQLDPGPDFVKQALDDAAKCKTAVSEVVAAGVPTSVEIHFGHEAITVGHLDAKVCDALATAANAFAKDKVERDKKFTEKFTKVGIAGDKLEIMKANDGGLFLPGGDSSSDYRKYAASSLIFVWLTSDPDDAGYVTHTVRRYQFAGNKLVKQTEKTYRKPKGAKLGDVFR